MVGFPDGNVNVFSGTPKCPKGSQESGGAPPSLPALALPLEGTPPFARPPTIRTRLRHGRAAVRSMSTSPGLADGCVAAEQWNIQTLALAATRR
jgi:hypothetical protein